MERLFKKTDAENMGVGFGFKITIYFVEDLGVLNHLVPQRFHRMAVSSLGAGLNLKEARNMLGDVSSELGSYPCSHDGQPGKFIAKIEIEIPPDEFPFDTSFIDKKVSNK